MSKFDEVKINEIAQKIRDYANEQIKILTTGIIPNPPMDSKMVAQAILLLIQQSHEDWAREEGMVQLDAAQEVPNTLIQESNHVAIHYYLRGQQDMLKANFRKIKQEGKNG